MKGNTEQNIFLLIPATLAGAALLIIVFTLLLGDATSASGIIHSTIWGFVVLGFFALLFSYLVELKKSSAEVKAITTKIQSPGRSMNASKKTAKKSSKKKKR